MTEESYQKSKYLSRYRGTDEHIRILLNEKKQWEDRAMHITPIITGMPSAGSGGSKIESSVSSIVDLEAEIDREGDELGKIRQEVKEAISTVGDERMERLLEYKYIHGMTLEQIAVEMCYSFSHLMRLYIKALSRVEIKDEIK